MRIIYNKYIFFILIFVFDTCTFLNIKCIDFIKSFRKLKLQLIKKDGIYSSHLLYYTFTISHHPYTPNKVTDTYEIVNKLVSANYLM